MPACQIQAGERSWAPLPALPCDASAQRLPRCFYTGYRWAAGTNTIKPDQRVCWIPHVCVRSLCNRARTCHASASHDFYITFIALADTHVLCLYGSRFSLTLYLKHYFKWGEARLKKKKNNKARLIFAKLCFYTRLKAQQQGTTWCLSSILPYSDAHIGDSTIARSPGETSVVVSVLSTKRADGDACRVSLPGQ